MAASLGSTWWQYLLLFLAVAASWAGAPVIGRRWGRQLMDRPGKHQAGREKIEERGERQYARWGWLAVFFTPAIVSGTADMPPQVRLHTRIPVNWTGQWRTATQFASCGRGHAGDRPHVAAPGAADGYPRVCAAASCAAACSAQACSTAACSAAACSAAVCSAQACSAAA